MGRYLECFVLARGLNRDLLILTEDGEVLNFEHICTVNLLFVYSFLKKLVTMSISKGPLKQNSVNGTPSVRLGGLRPFRVQCPCHR